MKRALLVIDVQNEYFSGKLPITYPNDSFSNILKSIDFANGNNIPVILIQHTAPQKDSNVFVKETKEWQIKEEVINKRYRYLIEKNFPDSFTHTNLEEILRKDGVDTVAICGYMTQMCCDTTARQAMHKGFFVDFLSDATGTLDISNYAGSISAEKLHNAILVTQAMRFSKVIATQDWIDSLKSK
jgi:nicotinamidase-related amidase